MSYPFKIQINNSLRMANGWPMRSVEPVIEQRIFITADPAIPTYYTMDSGWAPVGDFSVSANFSTSSAATQAILSADTDLLFRLSIISGSVWCQIGDGAAWQRQQDSGITINDGLLHSVLYEKSGDNYIITIDGVVASTATDLDVVTPRIDRICRSDTSNYFDGTVSNVTLTDLSNPSNSESWKLDQPHPINTEQSSSGNNLLTYVGATEATRELFTKDENDWLGVERVPQPINIVGDWIDVAGGSNFGVNTWDTVSTGGIRTGDVGAQGSRVRLEYSVFADSLDIGIKDSTTGQSADPTVAIVAANTASDGAVDYTATLGGVYLRTGGASSGNEITSMSLKRILQAP